MREHWRLKGGVARIRPAVDELVEQGRLRRLRVDDGGRTCSSRPMPSSICAGPARSRPPLAVRQPALGPPVRAQVLGFDHLIEVYKPAPQRQYGYYVLPFLRGDRIVGRADLKSERKCGQRSSSGPSTARTAFAPRAPSTTPSMRALARLARSIGLEEVRR